MRNGVKIDPDEAGRVALIRVKILSGNAGFERAVLPGAEVLDLKKIGTI